MTIPTDKLVLTVIVSSFGQIEHGVHYIGKSLYRKILDLLDEESFSGVRSAHTLDEKFYLKR